jgi:hypothetical protein
LTQGAKVWLQAIQEKKHLRLSVSMLLPKGSENIVTMDFKSVVERK